MEQKKLLLMQSELTLRHMTLQKHIFSVLPMLRWHSQLTETEILQDKGLANYSFFFPRPSSFFATKHCLDPVQNFPGAQHLECACLASFSILLDVIKLSCKSKIKGLSAGHKALPMAMFSVVCKSKTEGGGQKEGKELYALNFFLNLLKVFHHFPTFFDKTQSATFTNYKISFMCRVQANGTAKSREQED